VYVAFMGWASARENFDPTLGSFTPRMAVRIRRQIQELERQCRNDHLSEPVFEFPGTADSDDPTTDLALEEGLRELVAYIEQLGQAERDAFVAVSNAMFDSPVAYIQRAAVTLGWSVVKTQRAWDRVLYQLRKAVPGGLTELGII
jgi:DNA-directed RNA polymerase specialized sigma24 family protein